MHGQPGQRVSAEAFAGSLLAAGRTLRPAGNGVISALPAGDEGGRYDRRAAVYDRVVGARAYNRVMWGTSPAVYRAFAAEALASDTGPMLDAGCGSAVFTAGVYRRASRPLVLVDRSVGMLLRANGRLEGAPATLVHADLNTLPFAAGSFTTVGCFGTLHVLEEPWRTLAALWQQVAPGGRILASMLITDRALGGAYLRVLERAGEVGQPRSLGELSAAAGQAFGGSVEIDRTGSMAWLRARKSAAGATVPIGGPVAHQHVTRAGSTMPSVHGGATATPSGWPVRARRVTARRHSEPPAGF